jgi:hypothetical protein
MINVGDVNVVVKTVGKDGKMKIIVNGEEMNIDTDKILADIDLEENPGSSPQKCHHCQKANEAARPQMERSMKHTAEAEGMQTIRAKKWSKQGKKWNNPVANSKKHARNWKIKTEFARERQKSAEERC